MIAALGVLPGASAASSDFVPAELAQLAPSIGRWVFHGTSREHGKTVPFTWNENCRWSSNRLYLECTFSNVWGGKPVESLVVDTYNSEDHHFWHYELYASGAPSTDLLVSRMTIEGNTWIEYGEAKPGKPVTERIVYRWDPPARVHVEIQHSKDGKTWTVEAAGEGIRQ
jgi:hypothetical protein